MERKKKEQDVLVVRDEQTGEIGVVAGLKRDGTPNMKAAGAEHAQDFLRFDRHGDVLDNFFSNFFRQCMHPKRFSFYRVATEGLENVLTVMKEMLKKPDEYRDVLAAHRVDTTKYEQQAEQMRQEAQQETARSVAEETPDGVGGHREGDTESQSAETEQQAPDERGYKPIDDSRLDRAEVAERWGIDLAALEQSGDLERMRNYGKSRLIDCNPEIGGIRVPMQARLSLRENPDGTVSLVPHPIRRAPNYDEYLNVKFTPEDQENLKKTGNLGRVAEVVDPATGELLPSFVSIDRITNETVSVPVRDINIPQEVLGAALDDKQQAALARGEGVYVEGMTSKNNGKVSAPRLRTPSFPRSAPSTSFRVRGRPPPDRSESSPPLTEHAEDFAQRFADGRPEIDGLAGRNGIERPVPVGQGADVALPDETAPIQLSRIVPAGEGDALLREVYAVNPSLRTQLQQTLQVGAAPASDVQNIPFRLPVHLPHAAAGQRSVETVHSAQNHPSPESLRTTRIL